MFLEDLKKIKDNELLTRFSMMVQKEREAIATVVFYLSEIARRRLYLEEAYCSLFSFVTQKFHYSEGAAYRRIQAAKVSQLYPEILGLLSQGKVSLMTVSLIEPHLTKEKGREWIEKIIGKSKREVEFMLSGLSLKKENHRDIIRRLPVFRGKEERDLKKTQDNREDQSILSEEEEEKRGSDLRQEQLPGAVRGNDGQEKRADISKNVSPFLLPSGEPESAQNHTITGGNSGEEDGSFTNGTGAQRSATFTGGESSRGFTGETSVLHSHPSTTKESATPSVRKIKIEFVAKEEMAQKIERAKELLRHKFPEGRFEDIFNQALEDMLEKRDPQRKIERAEKKSEKASEHGQKMKSEDKDKSRKEVEEEKELAPFSRHISEQVRRKVFERDGGECSYESADGRRCGERNFIQIDHEQPFALWGKSTEENLRLLCRAHNQFRAEKTFGKWG